MRNFSEAVVRDGCHGNLDITGIGRNLLPEALLFSRGRLVRVMTKRANMVDMEHLTNLTRRALASPGILRSVELLKKEVLESEDPFVWRVLSAKVVRETFPEGVLSGWIFVLKPDTCSPRHQHPNSVQYSVIIEGGGKIRIGEEEKEIQVSGLGGKQPVWYVIPRNVPHAVTTRGRPNVVLSFHTCPSNELLEVETSSGRSRFYERC